VSLPDYRTVALLPEERKALKRLSQRDRAELSEEVALPLIRFGFAQETRSGSPSKSGRIPHDGGYAILPEGRRYLIYWENDQRERLFELRWTRGLSLLAVLVAFGSLVVSIIALLRG